MNQHELKTISELAEEHHADRRDVRVAIEAFGIPTYPVPRSPNARGIDKRGQVKLERFFKRRRKSKEIKT